MNKLPLIIIVCFCYISVANSQEKLTLKDAIKLGLQNNYSIKISTLEKDILENSLGLGTSAFLPSLDLKLNQNNTNNNVKQSFYDGREIERNGAIGNTLEGNLTANWTIFDGMAMFIDYDILKLNDKLAKLKLKKNIEDLTNQIINIYNELYYFKQYFNILNENLSTSRYRFQIMNQRKEAGKASGMELMQAEIDLNKDVTNSIIFNNNYELKKTEFKLVLGVDNSREFEISDTLIIDNISYDFDLLKNSISNNTELQMADLGVEISNKNKESISSNYFPKVNLYGGFNYSSSESQSGLLKSNTNNGFNYGISLNMNLFEGFKNNTLAENKEIESQISKMRKEEIKDEKIKLLKNYIDSYNSFSQIISVQEKNLNLSQNSLEIAKEKLKIGTISQIEFREIQTKNNDTYNQLLLTKINLKIIESSILKSLGKLVN